MPPKSRDDLKAALGDKITVQESDWNCVLIITPNNDVPPFDNVTARRALTLAVDRWGGSKYLSQIAVVKTVGGAVFPGPKLSATNAGLEQLAGYWPDLAQRRAESSKRRECDGVARWRRSEQEAAEE